MWRRLGPTVVSPFLVSAATLAAAAAAGAAPPLPRALCFSLPPQQQQQLITTATTAMVTARRAQGSLQSLMSDPDDAYLQAIQQLDLPHIAAIVAAGPSLAPHRTPAADRLQREQSRIQQQRGAAALPRGTGGGAVLAALREEGLRRVAATEAREAAAQQRAAQQRTPSEEQARVAALRATHLYEGLCAASAVLRVQVEDGSITPEELDAAYEVFATVVARRAEVPAAEWAADFVPELKSFQFIFNAKDDRELKF